jgi:hypothetical protein
MVSQSDHTIDRWADSVHKGGNVRDGSQGDQLKDAAELLAKLGAVIGNVLETFQEPSEIRRNPAIVSLRQLCNFIAHPDASFC